MAFLAGTLEFGGAEKQLVYMARALQEAGLRVRVYTLGENDVNEAPLRDAGLGPKRLAHWRRLSTVRSAHRSISRPGISSEDDRARGASSGCRAP